MCRNIITIILFITSSSIHAQSPLEQPYMIALNEKDTTLCKKAYYHYDWELKGYFEFGFGGVDRNLEGKNKDLFSITQSVRDSLTTHQYMRYL